MLVFAVEALSRAPRMVARCTGPQLTREHEGVGNLPAQRSFGQKHTEHTAHIRKDNLLTTVYLLMTMTKLIYIVALALALACSLRTTMMSSRVT